jgi:hypothetical protein
VTSFPVIAFGDVLFQAVYDYQLGTLYNGHKLKMSLDFAYTAANQKNNILGYFKDKNVKIYDGENFMIITTENNVCYKFHNIVLNRPDDVFKYIDLQSSMIYYDGEIKTNAIGAYCIGSKVNIYNYKKKIHSLDYDARLQQMYFAYGVRIIFLNTKISHIKNNLPQANRTNHFNINIVDGIGLEYDPYTLGISFDYFVEMRRKGLNNQLTADDVLQINPNGTFTVTMAKNIEQETRRDVCYEYYYIDLNHNGVPSEYFNSRFYVPFVLLDPKVETLLRLLVKHKKSVFHYLDRNTLNIILTYMILF